MNHILKVYKGSTEEDIVAGSRWYFKAHDKAVKLGKLYTLALPQVVGVIAALSPSVSWVRNIADTETLLQAVTSGNDTFTVTAYGNNKRKAVEIAKGGDPLEILGGSKVLSFYDNILNPGTSSAVTIDGHAYSIWKGIRYTLGGSGSIPKITPKRYEEVSSAYCKIASKLAVMPHQVQATTWLTWRKAVLTGRYAHIAQVVL
jgi:hypothetical protein